MLNRINNVTYEKCYPSRLKKLFQASLNYKTYDEFIPQMKNACVGCMPKELVKPLLGSGNIPKLNGIFADLAEYIRESCYNFKIRQAVFDLRELDPEDLSKFEKETSDFLTERFKQFEPYRKKGFVTDIKYVGRGAYKNVFRLSVKDETGNKVMTDKALQVYFQKHVPYALPEIHNNYAEANFWTFLKFNAGHDLGKTQFTRHYISDTKSGYCMTEFADSNIQKTTSELSFEDLFGIRFLDMCNNPTVSEKLYDGGGFKKREDFIDDKIVRRYFKKLFYRNPEKDLMPVLKRFELKAQNPKEEHRFKIQKAIDYFKDFYDFHLAWKYGDKW